MWSFFVQVAFGALLEQRMSTNAYLLECMIPENALDIIFQYERPLQLMVGDVVKLQTKFEDFLRLPQDSTIQKIDKTKGVVYVVDANQRMEKVAKFQLDLVKRRSLSITWKRQQLSNLQRPSRKWNEYKDPNTMKTYVGLVDENEEFVGPWFWSDEFYDLGPQPIRQCHRDHGGVEGVEKI
jgi:hypothetical protein